MELTPAEVMAVKLMIDELAERCNGEDLIGAILYTGAFRIIKRNPDNDDEIVALADKLKFTEEEKKRVEHLGFKVSWRSGGKK